MAAPFYFFAGRSKNDLLDPGTYRFRPAPLASAGLDETWRDVVAPEEQGSLIDFTGKGPGGKSGLLVTIFPPTREAPKRLGYYPDFQRWLEVEDGVWIGIDREQPPTADDLRREGTFHRGYEMKLADGGAWTVPVVRRPEVATERGYRASDLPHDIGWDRARKFVETLKPDYQALWDDTAELCEKFYGTADGKTRSISVEDGLRWAIRLLSLNYRYGRHEQNLLHAIDAETVFPVLGAAVDFVLVANLLELQKKSAGLAAPEASNMPPGSPASSPATAQAAASCT